MTIKTTIAANNGITASTTSITFSLSGLAAGDGFVALLGWNGSTVSLNAVPSGWTVETGPQDQGAGNRAYLVSKVLTSGDITAGSVTFTTSSNARSVGVAVVVDDPLVAGSDPFGAFARTAQLGTAPSLTTAAADSDLALFALNTVASGNPPDITWATGTEGATAETALASGTNMGAYCAYIEAGAVGSYGGGTLSGGSSAWQAFIIEVKTEPAGPPPATMSAGSDQAGKKPGQTITLDSSASTGVTAGRTWSQTGGSPTVALSSTSATSPTFTAPPTMAGTTLTFRVTDNATATFDEVQVAVLAAVRRIRIGGTETPVYRKIRVGGVMTLVERQHTTEAPPPGDDTYDSATYDTSVYA